MRHHTRLTLAAATMIAIAVAGGSPACAQAQQPATPAPATTPSPGTTPAPATSMPNQMEHGRPMGTGTEDNKMPMMGGQGHPGSMMGGQGQSGSMTTTASPTTTPAPTTTTAAPATSMPTQMERGGPMGPAMGEANAPMMGGQEHPGPMMGGQGQSGSTMGGMGGQNHPGPMGAMPPCPAGQTASGTPPTCK